MAMARAHAGLFPRKTMKSMRGWYFIYGIISCYTSAHVHKSFHQSHKEDSRSYGGGAHHYGAWVLRKNSACSILERTGEDDE
jgi:hypothetical protein